MYWNHVVEKIVFYNTSQSGEPLIYNHAYLGANNHLDSSVEQIYLFQMHSIDVNI